MKAIILVGGEGTRLRPLSLHRLKCTVPIAGTPFLQYQFAVLKRHGVRDITLSICHQPELVRKAFGTGSRYGVRLHYASEKSPLGTGGAIKNCRRWIAGGEPVAVLNGDQLADWDFSRMLAVHEKNKAALTIGLTWVEDPSAFGLVFADPRGRVQRFVEKPNVEEASKNHWVNAGLYIFDPRAFDYIPTNTKYSAERQLFPGLLAAGERVWSYGSRAYWKDIGTLAKYHQANMDALEGQIPMLPVGLAWQGKTALRIGKNNRIHASAKWFAPGILGDRCRVEADAILGEFVILGNQVHVGRGAQLQRCVIWDRVQIGEGAQLNGCVVASGCRIGRFAVVRPGSVLGQDAVVPDFSQV